MPGAQQVQPALGPVMDGGGAGGWLLKHLLGLALGAGERGVSLLARLAGQPVSLGTGRGAGLVGLAAGGGDGPLRLLLSRGQHPLGLLASVRADSLGLLLRLGLLLGDLV